MHKPQFWHRLTASGGSWGISSLVHAPRFWAGGSGVDFALGAAHALLTLWPDMSPKELLRRAIDAACAYRLDCGGEITIEQVK